MQKFIHEDFLLETDYARYLYHNYAKEKPVIDFHCHLDPELIAEDYSFKDLTEIWLKGDHYKWRAMRANGIPEEYITGKQNQRKKFFKWAETVPNTMRNPLYHWTHLELSRYFGINELLNESSAESIYARANEMLGSASFSCRNLLRKMKVEVVCTTDDPIDDLKAHRKIAEEGYEIKVLPSFRPDKTFTIHSVESYNHYLDVLAEKAGIDIQTFDDLIEAIQTRHDYFHSQGCRVADHGLLNFNPSNPGCKDPAPVFLQIRKGKPIDYMNLSFLQNSILLEIARMNSQKGWVQQFHYGALRNNNTRMFHAIGPDTGFDSIGDIPVATAMSQFFDLLDQEGQLAKTIVYNLNPAHNHVVATMLGNFQDGKIPGKMQFGSGWWFLDQKDGMEAQMNVLSNMGLLSRFVGMLSDSRSFMSYPRHEYFRRILCNMLGNDIKKGLLPADIPFLGNMVGDISYGNARNYFGF